MNEDWIREGAELHATETLSRSTPISFANAPFGRDSPVGAMLQATTTIPTVDDPSNSDNRKLGVLGNTSKLNKAA